jgi:hypothetical protein
MRKNPEAAGLLAAGETRSLMEADNVGMEQLVAALARMCKPRRKTKTSKST